MCGRTPQVPHLSTTFFGRFRRGKVFIAECGIRIWGQVLFLESACTEASPLKIPSYPFLRLLAFRTTNLPCSFFFLRGGVFSRMIRFGVPGELFPTVFPQNGPPPLFTAVKRKLLIDSRVCFKPLLVRKTVTFSPPFLLDVPPLSETDHQ